MFIRLPFDNLSQRDFRITNIKTVSKKTVILHFDVPKILWLFKQEQKELLNLIFT